MANGIWPCWNTFWFFAENVSSRFLIRNVNDVGEAMDGEMATVSHQLKSAPSKGEGKILENRPRLPPAAFALVRFATYGLSRHFCRFPIPLRHNRGPKDKTH